MTKKHFEAFAERILSDFVMTKEEKSMCAMSLELIRAMNDKATQEARRFKLSPYVARCAGDTEVRKAPRLGYFLPKGWEFVQEYFVDSSGLGGDNEPALTFGQFLKEVKAGYRYGIGEVGQFQLYVREYQRV